ncbi:MAG: EamA family transporter [Ktedonobacteraceae bacterium]
MSWIVFAIVTQVLFAVSNFIDKFLIDKRIRDTLLVTILAGLASFLLGLLIFLVRGFSIIETKQLVLILISGILLELYLIPYFKALTMDEVSRIVPLFQFMPVFVLILSYFILGEALTGKQFLGSVFIIGGGFILAAKKIEGGGIFKLRKSLWLMVIASLLYAVTGVLFKWVVVAQDFWLTLAYEDIGMGIGAIILLLWPSYRAGFRRETRKLKLSTWGLLFVNETVYVLALLSMFYAILLGSVALVSVIGGVQPFFVLLYGLILSIWFPSIIQEDIQRETVLLKALAILLIFIGGYLVYI